MAKRSYDEFVSDNDLQCSFGDECDCVFHFSAGEEESSSVESRRKRFCAGLASLTEAEDLDHDYLSHRNYEEYNPSYHNYDDHDSYRHYSEEYNHDYNLSEQYDDEYDSSYECHEPEEDDRTTPDFECQEDMHRWMLKNIKDKHRTDLFKDLGKQYAAWMACDDEKTLDGGVLKAMTMLFNLCNNTLKCDCRY